MFSHNLPKIYFLPFGVLMLFKKKKVFSWTSDSLPTQTIQATNSNYVSLFQLYYK